MKSDMFLDAIGKINDTYIASAQKRLAEGGKGHRHVMIRRVLPAAAAVVILLLSSFGVAMAANEDFRNMMLRLFRISEPDIVLPIEEEPEQMDSVENIGSTNTEDAVQVTYIRVDGAFTYNNGIIYQYDEWNGYDEGDTQPRYALAAYAVEDGALLQLEPHYETLEYTWDEETYQISFDWYERDGMIYSNAQDYNPETSLEWYVLTAEDHSECVALILSRGQQIEYEVYPLLYSLESGEVISILDRYEELTGKRVTEVIFSPNLTKLLIFDDTDMIYCCDTVSQTLWTADELSRMDVFDAGFVDDDTIYCVSRDEKEEYTCRTVTLSDGEYFEDFAGMRGLNGSSVGGVRFTGGRYVLYVDETGEVFFYDLKTGELAVAGGFRYPSGDPFVSTNRAGDKILYVQYDTDAAGLGVSEIGVLNLEKKVFTLFDREGYEIRYENSIGWFDNDSVAIRASGEEYGYLYLITVREPEESEGLFRD